MIRLAVLASAALTLAACSGEKQSGAAPPPAAAATPAATASPGSGAAFVDAVAQSDLYEVQSSRMARTRASSMPVKLYAQKMMDVHTQTTAELSTLLAGVEGARIPVRLDASRQALLSELRAASPADFEAVYLKQQADAHRQALGVLEGYAEAGDNPGLKAFAAKTAPTVKAHLDELATLGGGASSAGE